MFNTSILIFIALFISTQTLFLKDSEMDEGAIRKQLETIVSNYHNAFEAFYAIDELRPYSIIQFDKTIDLYKNVWVAPNNYTAKLSIKDKSTLIESLTSYLHSLKGDEQIKILVKLRSWCAANIQMDIIEKSFMISKSQIVQAIVKLNPTDSLIDDVMQNGHGDIKQLDYERYDEMLYKSMDAIASLNPKDQLKYYSNFFKELENNY